MKLIFLLCMLLFSCSAPSINQDTSSNGVNKSSHEVERTKFTYRITASRQGMFGYEIFHNESMIIKQSYIPSIQGLHEFRSKLDAEKLAKLMVSKLSNDEMPPTITVDEIKTLKIQY